MRHLSLLLPLAASIFPWTASAETPRNVALLVGISTYGSSPTEDDEHKWRRLNGTHNDVEEMRKLLTSRGFDVTVLTDAEDTPKPTKAAIKDAIQTHLTTVSDDGVALFYFSGHGQQVTDVDGDETDGLDEALVPWDNAGTLDGSRHVLDDDLRLWMAPIRDKTENVVMIVDACHSGTVSRGDGTIRGAAALPASPNRQSKKASRERASGLDGIDDDKGLVTLSAARSGEPALEDRIGVSGLPEASVAPSKKEIMGVMTFLLTQALHTAPANTTWQQLADTLRIRMRARGYLQQPQVEGDVHKQIFSGELGDPVYSHDANLVEDGQQILVQAGSLHGLGIGDVLALFAAGPEVELDLSAALARARIVQLDLSTSLLSLEAGHTLPASAQTGGLQAVLASPSMQLYVPRIDLTEVSPATRTALGDLASVSTIDTDGGQGEGDLVLHEENGAIRILEGGADGATVPIPTSCGQTPTDAIAIDHPDLHKLLSQAIEFHRIRTRIQSLENVNPASNLSATLEIHAVDYADGEIVKEHGSIATRPGGPRLAPNEPFRFRVVNHENRPVYFAILEFKPDGGVQYVYPGAGKGRDVGLIPKRALHESGPFGAEAQEGRTGWKLVVTEDYVPFQAMERGVACMPQPTDSAPRGLRGGSESLASSPLVQLFNDATLTTRAKPVTPEPGKAWGTSVFFADIAPEPEIPPNGSTEPEPKSRNKGKHNK